MHFVTAKGILSSGVGMNIYRGCSHGCIYCDSRSRCYQFTHAFEDIEVDAFVVSLDVWEGYEQYRAQILNNPIYAVEFALENWEYKDPLYPQKLCK